MLKELQIMSKDKEGQRITNPTNMTEDEQRKEIGKAYEKYVKEFTPKPKYLWNCCKAFVVGGAVCCAAFYVQNLLQDSGIDKDEAGAFVSVMLICLAQLLTGIGVFDTIAKHCGAGVIVPITGFANSMVAPALEYKKEGPVLGVGAKLFSVAGPVLVCGIASATVVGVIYWLMETL